MYSAFMDHLVNYIPERWVEKSGGPFIRAISKLYPENNKAKIVYGNLQLTAPWGISSGWADSIQKMNALSRLGAGLVISKTITLEPRYGNPYPRILRKKPSMINSMGLPNPGLMHWIRQLNQVSNIPKNFIFSLNGESTKEWNILVQQMNKYQRPLELNFSCPNVAEGVIDLDSTANILKSVSENNEGAFLFLKLSPQYSDEQLLDLIDMSVENEYIQGISLFNTFPVKHDNLGNPRKAGGLSGPKLYPRLIQILPKIRKKYSNSQKLPILAIGGISSLDQALTIYENFDAIPLILTAFLMQGPFIFKNWWRKYSKSTRAH